MFVIFYFEPVKKVDDRAAKYYLVPLTNEESAFATMMSGASILGMDGNILGTIKETYVLSTEKEAYDFWSGMTPSKGAILKTVSSILIQSMGGVSAKLSN